MTHFERNTSLVKEHFAVWKSLRFQHLILIYMFMLFMKLFSAVQNLKERFTKEFFCNLLGINHNLYY